MDLEQIFQRSLLAPNESSGHLGKWLLIVQTSTLEACHSGIEPEVGRFKQPTFTHDMREAGEQIFQQALTCQNKSFSHAWEVLLTFSPALHGNDL